MTKEKFLKLLRSGLSDLPREEIDERINFYSEMIADRMEEGLSEEAVIADIGDPEEIAKQIVFEALPKAEEKPKEKVKAGRKLRAWEIVLLVLGSPLWIALLAAVFAVVISLLAALWSVIVSFWAVFASLAGSALGVLAGGALFAVTGDVIVAAGMLGGAMVCAGLAIFAFFGCKAATKGAAFLSKWTVIGIVRFFKRKGEA